MTVTVSEHVVVKRLRRRLRREGRALVASREGQWETGRSDWYVVNLRTNRLEAAHIEIETWARERGVLQPHEVMATGG
jgi:hypothetical protein